MKTKIELWTIKDLYSLKEEINEQPRYQRGSVWPDAKKSLLIDSMLRGMDMPKIFLDKKERGQYKFEVADGQQRITSILKFKADKLALRNDKILGLDLQKIGRFKIGGKTYSELPKPLKSLFDNYLLTIALIEDASRDEIRTLFGRLQLGETLKPAEKRNAIICKVGNDINTLTLTHPFFLQSKIKKDRFNQQDYLAHAFSLIAYNNSNDLKAKLIEEMYLDESLKWTMSTYQRVVKVLDAMNKIDKKSKKRIEKKFWFLDIFWFLYKEVTNFSNIEIEKFAVHFDTFEQDRLSNSPNPENLLSTNSQRSKDLYDYIMAFKFEGLRSNSYDRRNKIITKEFRKFI